MGLFERVPRSKQYLTSCKMKIFAAKYYRVHILDLLFGLVKRQTVKLKQNCSISISIQKKLPTFEYFQSYWPADKMFHNITGYCITDVIYSIGGNPFVL